MTHRIPPKPPHEVNAPANILTFINIHRAMHHDLVDSDAAKKLIANIEAEAHKAGLQLWAINAGEPLSSVEINAQYAEGWRFTGSGPVKKGGA